MFYITKFVLIRNLQYREVTREVYHYSLRVINTDIHELLTFQVNQYTCIIQQATSLSVTATKLPNLDLMDIQLEKSVTLQVQAPTTKVYSYVVTLKTL